LRDRAAFVVIGRGPEQAAAQARAQALGVAIDWRDEVPLVTLPAELARAAVVLGVFGAGPKAAMVVPNKVYQAAAAGRPLVTLDGPALREVLAPDEHCLVCPAHDPVALAGAGGRIDRVPTSAVVVTWEGGEATRRCVASLLAQERPPAEIVVVDNAS